MNQVVDASHIRASEKEQRSKHAKLQAKIQLQKLFRKEGI
jgi:hypothetical protein